MLQTNDLTTTHTQNISVIFQVDNGVDINVLLNNATIQELQQKFPSYDVLIDSYNIKFKDKDDVDLDDDDDLQDALDVNDGQPLLIKVIKTLKQKIVSVKQDLEIWLKSNKLYSDQMLSKFIENDVNELNDLTEALDSENDVNEFIQQLDLKIVLRKKLKKCLLTLVNTAVYVNNPTVVIQEPGQMDWNEGQMNINKHIQSENKNDNIYITCVIPTCGQNIPIEEYDSHALLHTLSGDALQLIHTDIVITYIECEYTGCNVEVNAKEYSSHILSHILSATGGDNNNNNNNNTLITCQYASCNQQKVPISQWEFHWAQHGYDEKKEYDEKKDKQMMEGWQRVPQQQKSQINITVKHRTMMVIGATGTGKSTLLNSMVNYLWDVKYRDKFRYKLILDKPKNGDNNINQAKSQTDQVKAYYLDPPILDYQLTVVDTPGFGDTRGIERDKKIKQNIKQFFETEIQELDVICFVIQAPQARLTPTQKYIFNEVLSIFGKDIADNIFVLFTFADAEDPPALAALKEDNVPYSKHFKLNNAGFKKLYDENNYDYMCASYYEMGIQCFKVLFQEMDSIKPKSLSLTKQVLTRRDELEVYIEGIQPTINLGYSILEGIRKEITFIQKYAHVINACKDDFKIEKQISKARQVPNNGTCTTTCVQCNYTCHKKCAYTDDKDKEKCSAINRSTGNCKVCPHKCHWMKHRNLPYTVEYYMATDETTVMELKNKYYDAKKQQSTSDQLIQGLTEKLNDVEIDLNALLNNVRKCINELSSIALRPSVLDQGDYIDKLIQSEEIKRDPGWEQRCESLRQLKKNQDTLHKVHSNEYDPWSQYKDVKSFLNKKQLSNDKDDEKRQYIEKKTFKDINKKKKQKKKFLWWSIFMV